MSTTVEEKTTVRPKSQGSTPKSAGAAGEAGSTRSGVAGKKVWIDIDNSPHVPFFMPIIRELEKNGIEMVLTARDMYQVTELIKFFGLDCRVIGGHYGKNKALKVLSNCVRSLKLVPTAAARPDLAVSHGSRAQILACKAIGVPTVMMHDYEHSTKTGFIEPDWTFMPEVIPDNSMGKDAGHTVKYPGLKEDVYVLGFRPDPEFKTRLGIKPADLLITLRPPATEAHYHNPEAEKLFDATMKLLADKQNVKAITLPRNGRQKQQIVDTWPELIASGRIIIPETPLNGLDLIWHSDLVISGGGTMNREAAALGVPVYSIFRGKIGAVDQYLANSGRLTMLETPEDVMTKIALVPWNRPANPENGNRAALQRIVESILSILEGKCPPPLPATR
jgi:predicted glycosyltransferase